MSADCLFCKIIRKEIPGKVVFENDAVLGFEDINPQAPCHVLFVPKVHIPTLLDVDDHPEVMADLTRAVNVYAREKGYDENGFRTVINCGSYGGQTVYHLHVHLLADRQMKWPPG